MMVALFKLPGSSYGGSAFSLVAARLAEVNPGFVLDTGETAQVDLAALVGRLAARAGARRVFRIVLVRAACRSAASGGPRRSRPSDLRPARLFEPPEPAQATALLPDAPPALFVWRCVRNLVVRADGPERVRGEGWAIEGELASLRDHYRVETEEGALLDLPRRADGGGAALGV